MRSLRTMNIHAAKGFVNTMAQSRGMTVVYHKEAIQPYTDPQSKQIHVSRPMAHWDDTQFGVWMGEVFHELGHHRGINGKIMDHFAKKGTDMKSMYGTLVNMFADVINDKQWAGTYDGAHRDVQAAQLYHAARGYNITKDNPPTDDKSRLMAELFSWYYSRRGSTFQPVLRGIGQQWESLIPIPGNLTALNDEWAALSDAQSIEDLIAKILPPEEIEKGNPPPQPQPGEGEGEGEGKEGQEGKGKAKGQAKGKGEGDPTDGEAWVRYRDLLPDNHGDDKPSNARLKGIKILYDQDPGAKYKYSDTHEVITDMTPTADELDYGRDVMEYIQKGADENRGLAGQITRIMQIRSTRRWNMDQKTGRLNGRALARIPGGKEDIFKKRTQPIITKDCAISVLGDMSGSMGGEKFFALGSSFLLLNQACTKIGIPCELNMFTERQGVPKYYVVKDFNRRITDEKIKESFAFASTRMGHNPDGEALLWTYNRLAARKEKKKVLIVLSDGQPAVARYDAGDASVHLKEVAEAIDKRCTLIAVGLMSTSVKQFYKKNTVVKDPKELEAMFLDLLQNNVI